MRHFLLLPALALSLLAGAANKKSDITVEPPYWWTGMAQDTLQLMVRGTNVGLQNVSVSYPGVTVAETVKLKNPDYLLLYLVVGPEAKPGTLDLRLGKKKIPYQLKARDNRLKAQGFDASDVLYLIMPDRFATDGSKADRSKLKYPSPDDRTDPNARHGGNIGGMRRHLDYVDSLGVTAVWVNPVLVNDMPGGAYHGYATTDYYNIDPRLGDNGQWAEFVDDAHGRGLKVVMDMIFNHSGSNHPWALNPPDDDWINFQKEGYTQTNHKLMSLHDPYASDYDRRLATDGWFVESMPDLNQRNPHLMKYLIQNSIWWIEDSGIDGIRMDTYPYADADAMAEWIDAVEREYPDFDIVGECWYNNEGSESYWQRGSKVNPKDPRLATVMDFVIAGKANKAFGEETGPWGGGLNDIYDHLTLDFLFTDPQRILTFLDNHDTDRFLLEEPQDLGKWKQALAFLLTSRGIPQIYYGTEVLMNGTKKRTDGDVRLDMPGGFPGDTQDWFKREGRSEKQNEAFDFLSSLLRFRKGNKAISEGTLRHFAPSNGMYVYERKAPDGQRVVVMMNGTDQPVEVDMARYAEILPAGTVMTDVLSGEKLTVSPQITFPARALHILQ